MQVNHSITSKTPNILLYYAMLYYPILLISMPITVKLHWSPTPVNDVGSSCMLIAI